MAHSGERPVYHRDIRWPNIIKRIECNKWFLIDWSDSSEAPTSPTPHLSPDEHSPKVFQSNHAGEVDIWGAGNYLCKMSMHSWVSDSAGVREIGKRWKKDEGITATMALLEIKVCICFLLVPPSFVFPSSRLHISSSTRMEIKLVELPER